MSLLFLLPLVSCGSGQTPTSETTNPPPRGEALGILYSADDSDGSGHGAIFSWDAAANVAGTSTPNRTISGSSTQINFITGLWVDTTNNRLYVASSSPPGVLVFDNASAADGNIFPTRIIESTVFQNNQPFSVAVDPTRNILYVGAGKGIFIFDRADTARGLVTPDRMIIGPATGLASVVGIFLDTTNDRLYVADFIDFVAVWDNASTQTGDVAPTRRLQGNSTNLRDPAWPFVDVGRNILYVSNFTGNSILIWDNASTVNGDTAPNRTLSGTDTTLNQPCQVGGDTVRDQLYVASGAGPTILVFSNTSIIGGNVTPARTITAPRDGSHCGLTLDLTR